MTHSGIMRKNLRQKMDVLTKTAVKPEAGGCAGAASGRGGTHGVSGAVPRDLCGIRFRVVVLRAACVTTGVPASG